MRIVRRVKRIVTMEELGKIFGATISQIINPKGEDYFIFIVDAKHEQISVYFRCEDVKKLLNIRENIFSEDFKITKKGIEYFMEEEQYKGGFNIKKIQKTIGKFTA